MKNIALIKQTALALSAGMLFAGCHTSSHESKHASSGYESGAYYSSGSQTSIKEGSGAQADTSSQSQVVIPLHEERLNFGKRTVESGQVTIRKIVKTDTVTQPMELRREMLVIEREPAGAQRTTDAPASADSKSAGSPGTSASETTSSGLAGKAFQEETYTIQLHEEQPMIEKSIVQSGRVVARKNTQIQQQSLQEQVRREDVQLDRRAAAQNVEVRGNFDTAGQPVNEPSGAQRPQSLDSQNQPGQKDSQSEQSNPKQTP